MYQRKKRRHFGLIRLFIAVLFSTGLVNSIITSIVVYSLVHAGLLTYNAETAPAAGKLLIFSVFLNIPICMGIAALSSKYMLKPVRDLIEGMNSLADGDFKTRVKVGKITQRYPAFEEITRSFNKMAQELESTEMLRSDFINNFSHEFKTPIVSIAGFAQLLQHGNLPADQQKEYLEIISDESKRLSAMATNVMDLTKIENQMILTDVTEYNLSEQIRGCILLLEDKWSKKGIDLQLDFDEYSIHANQKLLKQAWINLLDNAIKFTPDGGMVQVQMKEENQCLHVCIRNTGSEIPKESLDKIFNKFYQADESHSAQGNGIGLAIVKRVVELHGGTVQVCSENMETTFTVSLPQ